MNKWQRFWGHLRTVRKHRKMVRKLCFKCGLYWQGLTHDLSKYSPTEFWRGVKYFTGAASPHEGERKEYGYSEAWLHHKAKNKHHREYWQDRINEKNVLIQIPLKYIAEIVCDRVAACKIYLGDKYTDAAPLAYYELHKNENQFELTTRLTLETILTNIKDVGLDKALEGIKFALRA